MMNQNRSEDYYIRRLLNTVKISEIMTRDVISIKETDLFSLVEEKLRTFHIRHLPVVDQNNQLVGIVTQRDLYRIQSPRVSDDGNWFYNKETLDSYILKQVMTHNPRNLFPDDCVGSAVLLMVKHKYGCIPIVARERKDLCGIITQYDILKIAGKILLTSD